MPSRTGFGGNVQGISPELNRIVENSLYCSQAFSMGNPTEFALPGLFASSYLLDNGGYAEGIAGRKNTLAEVLQREGYQTAAFTPIFRPISNRYDRGFDDYYHLYDPRVISKNFSNTLNWYKSKFHSKGISKSDCIEEIVLQCRLYFSDILNYCEIWDQYLKNPIFMSSHIFSRIDYKNFKKNIMEEKDIFESNEIQYAEDILTGKEAGFVSIIRRIVAKRILNTFPSFYDIQYKAILLRNMKKFWQASTSYRSSKLVLADALYRILQGQQKWIKYPSAGYLTDVFIEWLGIRNKEKPFYAYLHYVDVHELNHYSWDYIKKNKNQSIELNNLNNSFSKMNHSAGYSGNMMYDGAISYVDQVISKLLKYLKNEDILKNTLIVISSDHGGSFPNIPIRDHNISHRVDCFYDELYRIPVIFYGRDIRPSEYSELVSSVDIAPTILDFVGAPIPESFKGHSLIKNNYNRDYILMENQGRGPCDLKRKPIKVCVRSKNIKLVYVAEPKLESRREYISELYDLSNDPDEYNNQCNNEEYILYARPYVNIARERIRSIQERT